MRMMFNPFSIYRAWKTKRNKRLVNETMSRIFAEERQYAAALDNLRGDNPLLDSLKADDYPTPKSITIFGPRY